MSNDATECNLPFERLPVCACDPGHGAPPTRLQRLECKARRGPCAERYEPTAEQKIAAQEQYGIVWVEKQSD